MCMMISEGDGNESAERGIGTEQHSKVQQRILKGFVNATMEGKVFQKAKEKQNGPIRAFE